MSKLVIAFRNNLRGRERITSRSVHSWPLGGERFISVLAIKVVWSSRHKVGAKDAKGVISIFLEMSQGVKVSEKINAEKNDCEFHLNMNEEQANWCLADVRERNQGGRRIRWAMLPVILDKTKTQFRIVMYEQLSRSVEFAKFIGSRNVDLWKYLSQSFSLVCHDESKANRNHFLNWNQGRSKASQTTTQDKPSQLNAGSNTLLPSKAHVSRPSDCSYSAEVESNPDDVKPREGYVRTA